MPTDKDFINYIQDQTIAAGNIYIRSMFGEYGIYCDDIFFGLICNNQLFIKPTSAGREFIGEVVEAPPYKGAKPSFLIEDQLEDKDWISELIRLTINELPPPKKKKKKK